MKVIIAPGTASGRISAPPSKSMTHRALICAALSEKSTVSGIDFSDDIKATLSCLKSLGAQMEICGDTVTLGGLDPFGIKDGTVLDCGESGSTLRFLIPICLLSGKAVKLTGHGRLMERPLDIYKELCEKQGILFIKDKSSVIVRGPIKSGIYEVDGGVSSQFISGLMFALPLCEHDSTIVINGKTESAAYINLTIKALADYGIRVTRTDGRSYRIYANQKPKSVKASVEGDYSNAAFIESFNLFGGDVAVEGLDENSLQGDKVYKEMFKSLALSSPTLDLSDCPDLAPILFAVAAAKNGAVFTGTARLRLKESDRALAMKLELKKLGVTVDVKENSVTVGKEGIRRPDSVLSGHNDHRIVMALSVLCTLVGGTVEGAEAVAKSYPGFFDDIKGLGISLEEIL